MENKEINKDELRQTLWEAGVQYGHQKKRWNPKMAPFIYGVKGRNHIIDLTQTIDDIINAQAFVKDLASKGGKILFVGTKRNAKAAVQEAALRTGNFFVNNRWLGGTLTNMRTISTRIKTLWNIEQEEKSGQLALHTKKEQVLIEKEKAKLVSTLGGIKQMHRLPNALFVVDPTIDLIAVKEANKLNIPVIAMCDTNADPDLIQYVIPANNEMQEAINLITNMMVDAYAEGAQLKVVPSVLKTKIVRKERTDDDNNDHKGRYNNHRNFNHDDNGHGNGRRNFNHDDNNHGNNDHRRSFKPRNNDSNESNNKETK